MFTIEDCTLSCGSALVTPATPGTPPTISLTWTSGRKKVFGGVVRALAPHEGGGARWIRPISLGCSLTTNAKGEKRFQERSSTITLRVEGAKAARRKLVGTIDLTKYASYERTSSKLTVPLEHGAGSLQLVLTAGWLKKSQLDDDEGSECSRSSFNSSLNGSNSDDDDDDFDGSGAHGPSIGVAAHPGQSSLESLKETSEDLDRWDGGTGEHAEGATGDGFGGQGDPKRDGALRRSGSFELGSSRGRNGCASTLTPTSLVNTPTQSSPPTHTSLAAAAAAGGAAETSGGSNGKSRFGLRRSRSFGTSDGANSPFHHEANGGGGGGGGGAAAAAAAAAAERNATAPRDRSTPQSRPSHRRVPSGGAVSGGRLHRNGSWGGAGAGQDLAVAAMALAGAPSTASAEASCGQQPPPQPPPQQQHGGGNGSQHGGSGGGSGGVGMSLPSMFAVPLEAMEEVLRLQLPIPLDIIQQSFEGFDCEHSRFGSLLCRRLGYMDVVASAWEGNEAEGMRREVRIVVKCPPKPMLPDTTRVHIKHKLQRQSQSTLMLEREVWTLDVPYGETWCLQERWLVATDPSAPDRAVELAVCAHVSFKSRGMLSTKIKGVALKRSRKCAALAAALLEEAAAPEHELEAASGGAAAGGLGESDELRELRERHDALLEEAHFYKQQASMLERENRRLQEAARHVKKTKKVLTQQLQALEHQLQKERRERAAMEEALTEAYSATLKEMVIAHENEVAAAETGRRGTRR